MSWNNIIGQRRAKNILQRAIIENRVAHAYCFLGIEGIGKDALAIEFAKTVNCEKPLQTETTVDACGVCKSCLQAASLQHPNIRLLFSLPAGKSGSAKDDDSPFLKMSDDQIRAIQEQMALKAEDPYHNITIPNASQIRIAAVRDVKKSITMSASQSGRRVVIISEADEMTAEAANAFLKTLEEPNANITLIMTSSKKGQLLQTILSRCQQINCDPLTDDEVTEALVALKHIPAEEAKLVASFAQGSFSKALEFLDEDMRQLRQDVVDLLRTALKPRGYRSELLHQLGNFAGEKDRTKVEMMLTLLMMWVRDAYSLAMTNNPAHLVNGDQQETFERFNVRFGKTDFPGVLKAIEEAIMHIKRNVHIQLALLTLCISCRRYFLGRSV
ncbi:MAG: hypothetical protein V4642_00360 [Bacteroidota bacterium]